MAGWLISPLEEVLLEPFQEGFELLYLVFYCLDWLGNYRQARYLDELIVILLSLFEIRVDLLEKGFLLLRVWCNSLHTKAFDLLLHSIDHGFAQTVVPDSLYLICASLFVELAMTNKLALALERQVEAFCEVSLLTLCWEASLCAG